MKGYFEICAGNNINVTVMQHDDIEKKLDKLQCVYDPKNIIEIGTAYGGFTYLLTKYFKNADIYSYDPNIRAGVEELAIMHNFHYINRGVALDDDISDEIINIINRRGKSIIFCDGGNKVNEFKQLAPHIKRGDLIMAHDYSKSISDFKMNVEGKIWDWCEITAEPLRETFKSYNLVPYMEDDFLSVAWGCFIKE